MKMIDVIVLASKQANTSIFLFFVIGQVHASGTLYQVPVKKAQRLTSIRQDCQLCNRRLQEAYSAKQENSADARDVPVAQEHVISILSDLEQTSEATVEVTLTVSSAADGEDGL